MSTILVVDDMPFCREVTAQPLRNAGYDVVTVAGAKEGLAVLSGRSIDLVILDNEMPEVSGLTFLRQLRESRLWRNLPVIMLTGSAEREKVIAALQSGATGYLLKASFNVQTLLERVRLCLGNGSGRELAMAHAASLMPAHAFAGLHTVMTPSPAARPSPQPPSAANPAPLAFPPFDADTRPAWSPRAQIESLKQLQPMITRAQLLEHVAQDAQLRAFSATVTQLINVTSNPDCSINQVANAILQDQVVALKVLKLANSVVYNRGEPVESVHSAVTRIGLHQIRQTVLNIGVIEGFSNDDLGADLAIAPFWEHSIACGLIAAEITHVRGGTVEDADTGFALGLLHDVGRVILAQRLGNLYQQTLITAHNLQLPLEQVEAQLLTMNHADVMEGILTAWRFPHHLIGPIACHHHSIGSYRHLGPEEFARIGTLVLANHLAHALLLGSSGNPAIYPTHDLIRELGMTAMQIASILSKIPDQVHDMKLVLLTRSAQAPWPNLSDEWRERLHVPLRPLFIAPKPEIDSLAFFISALTTRHVEGRPNLGIVHLSNINERPLLTRQLQNAEATAGVRGLPLIVISPTGSLTLDEAALAGRRTTLLNRPLHPERFIAAAQTLLAV